MIILQRDANSSVPWVLIQIMFIVKQIGVNHEFHISSKSVEVEVECAIEHGNLFGSLSLPCGISEDGSSPKDQDFVQITYHRAEKENRWIVFCL